MKDNKHIKKIVMMAVIFIVIMVTGVIVLAHDNDWFKPEGTTTSDGKWQVEFTSIVESEKTGNASSRFHPWHTATYASFYVDFVAPGDSITYELQVGNFGNIDAVLSDIDIVSNPFIDVIKYEVEEMNVGDPLKAGEVRNFKVKISYELHAEEAVTFNEPVSIMFTFVQDK